MAGTPTRLTENAFDYRVSEVYPTLYSTRFETAVFKLTMDSGLIGWGEAQAPLAPEVACTIARLLLRPIVEGAEFNGTRQADREALVAYCTQACGCAARPADSCSMPSVELIWRYGTLRARFTKFPLLI